MASTKMLKLTMMMMLGMLLLAAGISASRMLKQDDDVVPEFEPQEGGVEPFQGDDGVEAYNAIEGPQVDDDGGDDLPDLAHKRKLSTFGWPWRYWSRRFPQWWGGWPWGGYPAAPVPYATASVATIDGNATASAEAGFRQPDPQFPGVGPAGGFGNRLFG